MITDRTVQDINSAKKIREEKIQKFIALTQDDIKTLEKGFITINTLNRISNKQKEISDILAMLSITMLEGKLEKEIRIIKTITLCMEMTGSIVQYNKQ